MFKKAKYLAEEILTIPLVGILYLISLMPLRLLYVISDVLSFFGHKIVKYRLDVVRSNLLNAFPGTDLSFIKKAERGFYKHFVDVLAESVKLRTISLISLKKRFVFTDESLCLINSLYAKKQSFILALGHQGNWEWGGVAFAMLKKHLCIGVYRPLRNRVFDRFVFNTRERTGILLTPMKKLTRQVVASKNDVVAISLITDQTPAKTNAFWLSFMQQETPFYKGTEKLALKFKLPVVWASMEKPSRGKYICQLRIIADPLKNDYQEGDITRVVVDTLEKDIKNHPDTWLWSHRRWKHKRPEGTELIH